MEPLEQIPNRKRRLRCLNVAHPSLATLIQSNTVDDCFGSQPPTLKVGMGRHKALMMVDGKFPLRAFCSQGIVHFSHSSAKPALVKPCGKFNQT
jgi:hypothetical protein